KSKSKPTARRLTSPWKCPRRSKRPPWQGWRAAPSPLPLVAPQLLSEGGSVVGDETNHRAVHASASTPPAGTSQRDVSTRSAACNSGIVAARSTDPLGERVPFGHWRPPNFGHGWRDG